MIDEYGYLLPGDERIPSDMVSCSHVPYIIEDGRLSVVWPIGTFGENVDEYGRKQLWKLRNSVNDCKSAAFQLVGIVTTEEADRLRSLLGQMDDLIDDINRG